MTRELLQRLTGSLQQVAGIRDVTFASGPAGGLGAYEIKNGPMFLRMLKDRVLDIEELTYKGIGFNYLAKTGLLAPGPDDVSPASQRSIMGGFMFTAGLDNIGAPCTVDGQDYLLHGRIRSASAELLGADACWSDGIYRMTVRGQARQAALFGENLVLRRHFETIYGTKTFAIEDEIENQALRPEPCLILYHINIGYPLLDAGTELLAPSLKTKGRDEVSSAHTGSWSVMPAPEDNAPERVFLHTLAAGPDGHTAVCVANEKLGLGLKLEYSVRELPYFMEWQSTASGDYVLGIEPANHSVYGRAFHAEQDDLVRLTPLETQKKTLHFTILDGKDEIDAARREIAALLAQS